MVPTLALQGYIIGLSIAAPVGPIGFLCISRTLTRGRMSGLFTGLGAATADGFYGAAAAFGLIAVADFLAGWQGPLRIVGGLFLLYLGASTFFSKPVDAAATEQGGGLTRDYVSTFVLTLANPMTVLSFAAVFAGLGLGEAAGSPAAAFAAVAGVVLGSASWWLALSGGVSLLRSRVTPAGLVLVNRISGATIAAFGMLALAVAAA